MMADVKQYYHAYEGRYASVYSHGAEYWTADPEEIRDTTAKLQDFLDRSALMPGQARLVEFGCGEGHLARYLIENGYDYRGVDLSPSALVKARQRVADLEVKGDTFVLGDITSLPAADDGVFDVVVAMRGEKHDQYHIPKRRSPGHSEHETSLARVLAGTAV